MTDGRGYPLPDGEAYTDDCECFIVFVPAKEEYRRAFFGALDFFGNWLAWERDADKRGKDAARAWKDANEQTLECKEMGICDNLLSAINNNRYGQASCFCEYIEINPPPHPEPDIVPYQGDPPATWGDGNAVSGWESWRGYVCNAANAYVDFLEVQADQLADTISLGVIAIGFIAGILGIMSGAGILIAIAYGTAAGIFAALVDGSFGLEFDNVAAEIGAAREEIVKALSCGSSLAAAMQEAINPTAWSLFYQFVDWNAATAVIQSGEYNGEYLDATEGSGDCPACTEIPFTLTHTFDTDRQGWGTAGGVGWYNVFQSLWFNTCDATEWTTLGYSTILTQIGHPDADAIQIDSVSIDWTPDGQTYFPVAVEIQLGHAVLGDVARVAAVTGSGTLHQSEDFPDSPAEDTGIKLTVYKPGTACTGNMRGDNVVITGKVIYS